MSLHPDIIDAMIAAGATAQMVAAACRAAWRLEQVPLDARRRRDNLMGLLLP